MLKADENHNESKFLCESGLRQTYLESAAMSYDFHQLWSDMYHRQTLWHCNSCSLAAYTAGHLPDDHQSISSSFQFHSRSLTLGSYQDHNSLFALNDTPQLPSHQHGVPANASANLFQFEQCLLVDYSHSSCIVLQEKSYKTLVTVLDLLPARE